MFRISRLLEIADIATHLSCRNRIYQWHRRNTAPHDNAALDLGKKVVCLDQCGSLQQHVDCLMVGSYKAIIGQLRIMVVVVVVAFAALLVALQLGQSVRSRLKLQALSVSWMMLRLLGQLNWATEWDLITPGFFFDASYY